MVRTSYGMRHSKPMAINVFRDQVANAVNKTGIDELPLAGALTMSVTFVLPRPKSAPKRRIWPEVKPDLTNSFAPCAMPSPNAVPGATTHSSST